MSAIFLPDALCHVLRIEHVGQDCRIYWMCASSGNDVYSLEAHNLCVLRVCKCKMSEMQLWIQSYNGNILVLELGHPN